ncbi:hypothetical protein EXIGLDRAFT_73841 [Exidia glandulosa HHB12029]|uniref:Uncharacterized protein n=1 Tax=Exidia glandulosa HHB12029 TaxID=1314781 RepID=A0A165HVN6_EXIGL|nr:hypothetical protein EXIGLDRAFT_73841 [Exidia glandulosa HHB12029]
MHATSPLLCLSLSPRRLARKPPGFGLAVVLDKVATLLYRAHFFSRPSAEVLNEFLACSLVASVLQPSTQEGSSTLQCQLPRNLSLLATQPDWPVPAWCTLTAAYIAVVASAALPATISCAALVRPVSAFGWLDIAVQ